MQSQTSKKTKLAVKAVGAALTAAALLSQMTMPNIALAADETRVFTWKDGQAQPLIPQTITGSNGRIMYLTSQSEPVRSSADQKQTQYFQKSYTGTCGPNDIANLAKTVPATFFVNENGYVGDIPRVGNISYSPVNRTENEHKEQSRSGSVIDPTMVPQSITHEGRVYSLSGTPALTPARTDSSGAVILWKYNATYTFDRSYEVLDHYDVSAQYAGNLTKITSNGEWSLSAVYHVDDPAPVVPEQQAPVTPAPAPAPAPSQPENPAPAVDNPPAANLAPAAETPAEQQQQPDIETPAPVPEEQPNELEQNPEENAVEPEQNPDENQDADNENRENPFEGSGLERFNTNSSNTNDFDDSDDYDDEDDVSTTASGDSDNDGANGNSKALPIPLIGGIAAGAAALLGLLALLLAKRKKKNKAQQDTATPMDQTMAAGVAGAGMAGAGVVGAGVAGAAAGAAGLEEEPEPVCQLIAVTKVDDEFEQNPMADLSFDSSGDENIPSVVMFPDTVDEFGEKIFFTPEPDTDYWIAVEENAVDAAVSDKVVVATSDGQEIFRGQLESQFQLDTDVLTNSLNGTVDPENIKDISEELAEYAKLTDIAPVAAGVAGGAVAGAMASNGFTDDFEDDETGLIDTGFNGFEDESDDTTLDTADTSSKDIDIESEDAFDEDNDFVSDVSIPDDEDFDDELVVDYDESDDFQVDTDDMIDSEVVEEVDFDDFEDDLLDDDMTVDTDDFVSSDDVSIPANAAVPLSSIGDNEDIEDILDDEDDIFDDVDVYDDGKAKSFTGAFMAVDPTNDDFSDDFDEIDEFEDEDISVESVDFDETDEFEDEDISVGTSGDFDEIDEFEEEDVFVGTSGGFDDDEDDDDLLAPMSTVGTSDELADDGFDDIIVKPETSNEVKFDASADAFSDDLMDGVKSAIKETAEDIESKADTMEDDFRSLLDGIK